jgi:hypothetical protein
MQKYNALEWRSERFRMVRRTCFDAKKASFGAKKIHQEINSTGPQSIPFCIVKSYKEVTLNSKIVIN